MTPKEAAARLNRDDREIRRALREIYGKLKEKGERWNINEEDLPKIESYLKGEREEVKVEMESKSLEDS